ncbi:OmpA family protein [Flavobacterium sp. F-380]|uniref:OmpA family protein n=1 Tax=Flavobacterium kayseriense TaxID=2764714 RepID=A0ABR7J5P0_9FLAO|nr:OmpA family protein [Flavobacterium kayseriense]MBC5840728.1 OmpA family protein [Flavobacterium kayseriense]MBC5846602.1 OmpA family protein [Flavobacterium kayseriense]
MKTNFKIILAMLLIGMGFQNTKAQVSKVADQATQKTEWQFSTRAGYDFPSYKEDFKYIDYSGGIMGGVSVNHYWKWFGLQADFDYIKNSPKSNINNPSYDNGGVIPTAVDYDDLSVTKNDITRMFAGAGPSFRYLSKNNKFQAEMSLLAGLGTIDGGEILVEATRKNGSIDVLTYHSGWDKENLLAGKAQARLTYFFNQHWGVHAGAYYMHYFNGAQESGKNDILINKGYMTAGSTLQVYYYEAGTTAIAGQAQNGQNNTINAFNTQSIIRNNQGGSATSFDLRRKIDLSSIGVFGGLTYRFGPSKKAPKEIVEEVKTAPTEKKYCIQTTAKDKFTAEILPNTDVSIKDSKGVVVKTAKTDAFGVVQFCDLLPDDYTIEGRFNDLALEGNSTKKSEFQNNKTILKDILYADANFIIKGKAIVCNTSIAINDVSIVLKNNQMVVQKTSSTNEKGEFVFQATANTNYSIYGKKENYMSQTMTVSTKDYDRTKSLFIQLEICMDAADCGTAIALKNIHYDLGKYFIREDAKPELNRLVQFMNDNPGVKVELSSHTDSRASNGYNQILSQNRANAAVDYITSQGISRARLTGKGYGESKLLNRCTDGVECSEEQHQANRRTEVKVICSE